MPAVGMAMKEGLLVGWLKQPGDTVVAGEAVAEIETDKTTMELESPADGILGPHLFPAGATVPVGTPVSHVLGGDEDLPSTAPARLTEPPASVVPGGEVATSVESAPAVREAHHLSPRARRLARQQASREGGSEAAGLSAVKGDVPGVSAQPTSAQQTSAAGRHRALIAAKVSQSWHEIPHFGVTREIHAESLLSVRAAAKIFHPAITMTDLMLRALAQAFVRTTSRSPVNLGLAVATPQGVVIPILSDVLGRSLADLAEVRTAAVQRAISGTLAPEDSAVPADSTLSNLGDYDIDSFTGVIYPGQTSLLTVGRARPRVVVEDGSPAVRTTFFATLNVDHRTYDGADAARLLAAFADAIQDQRSLVTGGASDD